MTNHWPFHLEIHPEETREQWVERGERAVAAMARTDGFSAILDMLEGMAADNLDSAARIVLEPGHDRDAYVGHAAGAKALREAVSRLVRLTSGQDEPQEAVDRRARERLDFRRRRAVSRSAHAG